MSKVRNLTEITVLEGTDLFYAVDYSAGTDGGRKITLTNLKTSLGLDAFSRNWLQYSNGTLQTNATTTYTDLSVSNALTSVPGTKLTKSTSTQFRADFAGYVKVSYRVYGYTDTNDRSMVVRIAKNGTGQAHTVGQIYGKNVTERTSTASGSFIFDCAVNDYFTLQFASAEGGVTSTVPAVGAVMLVETYLVS